MDIMEDIKAAMAVMATMVIPHVMVKIQILKMNTNIMKKSVYKTEIYYS